MVKAAGVRWAVRVGIASAATLRLPCLAAALTTGPSTLAPSLVASVSGPASRFLEIFIESCQLLG